MKVVVKVIAGRNEGKEYDLTLPPTDNSRYVLCEDDVLLFIVHTINDRPNIHLALHEIFIPPTSVLTPSEDEPYFEYRWEPKRISNDSFRKEAFFHNYCGIAELIIVDKYQINFDSFDFDNIQQLQCVEVLARKINADRINSMLDFLARDDGQDLVALARITRKYAGYKEGDKSLTYTLDRVEQYLNFLEDALPKIVSKPIAKLVQVNVLKAFSKLFNLTEDSINHIVGNPEHIYEVSEGEDYLFSLEDRYFSVDKIIQTEIIEDTNLYENQVIHGFLDLLIKAVNDIQVRLVDNDRFKKAVTLQGYESLFNKLSQFSLRLNKPAIERCNDFMRRLRLMKTMLQFRLKVKQVITSVPYFTHKAKQNINYQKIFLMMTEWMRFGSPDWSLQNELNSIQNLSKLFEFYLFCVVKQHLLNYTLEFNGGLIESPLDGSNDSRFVFGLKQDIKAELLYEPDIFQADVNGAILSNYRNTEAWKNTSNNTFKLRTDRLNVQKRLRIRRAPDVVVRLISDKTEFILIIDAKYMTTSKTFFEEMPKCVMKYLHGIHLNATGQNTSIALMLVNPDEKDVTHHFHHDEYSIYGSKTVIPAILTASIDVAIANKLGSTLQKDLYQLLNIVMAKIEYASKQSNNTDLTYQNSNNVKTFDLKVDRLNTSDDSLEFINSRSAEGRLIQVADNSDLELTPSEKNKKSKTLSLGGGPLFSNISYPERNKQNYSKFKKGSKY